MVSEEDTSVLTEIPSEPPLKSKSVNNTKVPCEATAQVVSEEDTSALTEIPSESQLKSKSVSDPKRHEKVLCFPPPRTQTFKVPNCFKTQTSKLSNPLKPNVSPPPHLTSPPQTT